MASPTLSRQIVPARIAGLSFSMDVPAGFAQLSFPDDEVDLDNPTTSMPLALFSSQIAPAVITVSARPAYDDGSVEDWLRYLSRVYELDVVGASEITLQSGLRGVIGAASQVQDDTPLRFVLLAFEDGGRLVIAQAMCPDELWPSFGEAMRTSLLSFALEAPMGQSAPLSPAGQG